MFTKLERIETEKEVFRLWKPTGSNVFPLGQKLHEDPPTAPAASHPAIVSPTLETFSSKRFLPPPGGYYDQFTLELIFGNIFSPESCFTCWRVDLSCCNNGKCRNICKVCGTQDHPGSVSHHTYAI